MYAERIKEIRQKLNLSVAKMAEKIDIPARTITGYERAERMPSIEFAAQCCTVLNVNGNWFLTGKGDMFNATLYNVNMYNFKNEILAEVEKMFKDKGF